MKLRPVAGTLCFLALAISLSLVVSMPSGWAGTLRITMSDSTSVEVPYYWEEGGEVKFEIPGGVAGIPKDQVRSVQEIITAKEFDPESIAEAPDGTSVTDPKKMLRELVATKTPLKPSSDILSPDEGLRLMKAGSGFGKKAASDKERAYGPSFNLEGDFSEFVRVGENDVMVVMRNVLSSRRDLKNQSFALTLYDAEGKILEQKPCELREIDVDRKTLKKMGIQGRLYTVIATVKPNTSIQRYEITAIQR